MKNPYEVAVLVGSLRKDSVNRKAATALVRLAPSNLKFRFLEIGDLPFFNEDVEAGETPAEWLRFREELGVRRRSVRHARVQSICTGRIEKRHRCWITALWRKFLGEKACSSRKRIAQRDWRFWRQPSPATITGLPRHACSPATRSLYWRRLGHVR